MDVDVFRGIYLCFCFDLIGIFLCVCGVFFFGVEYYCCSGVL